MLGNMLKFIPQYQHSNTGFVNSILMLSLTYLKKKKITCHGFDHPDKTTDPGIATGW